VLGTLVDRDTVCCSWAKFGPKARETNERRGRMAAAERQAAGSSSRELPEASLCGGGLRLANLDDGPLAGWLPGGREVDVGSTSWHPDR